MALLVCTACPEGCTDVLVSVFDLLMDFSLRYITKFLKLSEDLSHASAQFGHVDHPAGHVERLVDVWSPSLSFPPWTSTTRMNLDNRRMVSLTSPPQNQSLCLLYYFLVKFIIFYVLFSSFLFIVFDYKSYKYVIFVHEVRIDCLPLYFELKLFVLCRTFHCFLVSYPSKHASKSLDL